VISRAVGPGEAGVICVVDKTYPQRNRLGVNRDSPEKRLNVPHSWEIKRPARVIAAFERPVP
jgi:hypothetical protein